MFALPRIMGHRGAAGVAPDNTLASIRAAAEAGCRWVEFDAMLTGDDRPVLFHDDTLDRTTGAAGRMDGTSLAELDALDAGAAFDAAFAGERIPPLEAAVHCCLDLDLTPNVEIKPSEGRDRETAAAVAETLVRQWPSERPVMISSFKTDCLAVARDRAPALPRGLIALEPGDDWRDLLQDLGCVSLHLHDPRWTADLVTEVRAAGYRTAAFTVNHPERARTLLGWGLDCVITDQPGLLFAATRGVPGRY